MARLFPLLQPCELMGEWVLLEVGAGADDRLIVGAPLQVESRPQGNRDHQGQEGQGFGDRPGLFFARLAAGSRTRFLRGGRLGHQSILQIRGIFPITEDGLGGQGNVILIPPDAVGAQGQDPQTLRTGAL